MFSAFEARDHWLPPAEQLGQRCLCKTVLLPIPEEPDREFARQRCSFPLGANLWIISQGPGKHLLEFSVRSHPAFLLVDLKPAYRAVHCSVEPAWVNPCFGANRADARPQTRACCV